MDHMLIVSLGSSSVMEERMAEEGIEFWIYNATDVAQDSWEGPVLYEFSDEDSRSRAMDILLEVGTPSG